MVKKTAILLVTVLLAFSSSKAQYYKTPEWLSEILLYGEMTSVGISDPRMDDEKLAKEQAIMRAKAMIALQKEMLISYTSEHYQSESEEHRTHILEEIIEKLGRYQARLPYSDGDFKLVKEFRNENDETIVLMSYTDAGSDRENVLKVSGEFYSKIYETSITNALQTAMLTSLNIKDSLKSGVDEYSYDYESNGSDVNIVSDNNGEEYTPPGYSYRYNNTDNIRNFTAYDASFETDKGLWIAFLNSFMMACNEDSKNYTSSLKDLGDTYQENQEIDYDLSQGVNQEGLLRQIAKNKMKFYLNSIKFSGRLLYISTSNPQMSEDIPSEWIDPAKDTTKNQQNAEKEENRSFWDWLFFWRD